MLQIKFYDKADDCLLKFAVIVSRYENKWVFCRHKDRNTYEIPGGHREAGEAIMDTAERELFEETGAVSYELREVCVYSVEENADEGDISYGMLYYAEIKELGTLPDMEMEAVVLFEEVPGNLTYPLIQPRLMDKIKDYLK